MFDGPNVKCVTRILLERVRVSYYYFTVFIAINIPKCPGYPARASSNVILLTVTPDYTPFLSVEYCDGFTVVTSRRSFGVVTVQTAMTPSLYGRIRNPSLLS